MADLVIGTVKRPQTRSSELLSITDAALAEYLGLSGVSAGVSVSENSILGITAWYRGCAIVAGTIAGLPLKTYRDLGDNKREKVPSVFDNPAGPYPLTPFAWTEMVLLHLLNRGETFLRHIYNGAGALIGFWPVHPAAVTEVKWEGADKRFKVQMADGKKEEFTTATMTHVMGMTMDGLRGISPITVFRQTYGLSIAGERAAARGFSNGMLIAGLVTTGPGVDVDGDEAKVIKAGLNAKMAGVENAGDIAFVNRDLVFKPWSMTNEDAQFLQSRVFQIDEMARLTGVPPHLLAATEKQTSWGTGVAEQNLGLARYTLMSWTSRLEQAYSRLLPDGEFTEYEYAGLLQGTPAEEIDLLIKQVQGGLLTEDEARAIRNLPPKPKQAPPPAPPASPDPTTQE